MLHYLWVSDCLSQHDNHGTVYIAIEGHHIGIILLKIVFNFRSMKIMWIKEINWLCNFLKYMDLKVWNLIYSYSRLMCSIHVKGLSWPWSYGSWIYNYLCNQCLSPLKSEFKPRSWWDVQHYVMKFVSDLQQVGGFLWVLRFPPPIKLTTTI
jgi:hypothetical protein